MDKREATGYGISFHNKRDSGIAIMQNSMVWMAKVKQELMLNMKYWVRDSVNVAERSCYIKIRASEKLWEATST